MKRLLIYCILLFSILKLFGQDSSEIIIGFYNVENLFNPDDDSIKNDDAFTPDGFNHWTYKKYVRKVNNIAKVLLAVNDWSPPDIMGFAEVEEASVLKKLCYDSPLKNYHYRFVHHDSPDARGVDVALIYRTDRITILRERAVPIVFPFDTSCRNRDLLYVVARLPSGDSIHIVVNHWTSRYGGYAPTIPKRNYYASVVRSLADSILEHEPTANILITGDFNDYPTDESITEVLRAGDIDNPAHTGHTLFDLMYRFLKMQNIGTHKHEDFWGCLDQIIVSPALLDTSGTYILRNEAHIFKADFMVEPDDKFGGYRVFRTYSGPRYIGGYADHLPVFVRVIYDNPADSP